MTTCPLEGSAARQELPHVAVPGHCLLDQQTGLGVGRLGGEHQAAVVLDNDQDDAPTFRIDPV